MGKHEGAQDYKPGTDAGDAFDTLKPEEKAQEFDASHEDPRGYANRNFGSDTGMQSGADGLGQS
jgi:hypothetical protein